MSRLWHGQVHPYERIGHRKTGAGDHSLLDHLPGHSERAEHYREKRLSV